MINRVFSHLRRLALPMAVIGLTAAGGQAQTFPEPGKPITIIVPNDAGGGIDVLTRLIAPFLEKELGTQIKIENRPGGATQVGLTYCSVAKPDGYTLCTGGMPSANSTYLNPDRGAPYNRDSFVPLGIYSAEVGSVIVAGDSPYKTLEDLISAARTAPGKIKVGNAGRLSSAHLDILEAERATGVQFAPVFFTGGAPAITALLGGHVDAVFSYPSNYMQLIESGDVRALGVMSPKGSPMLPDVPTFQSAGYDAKGLSARVLFVQKDVPAEIVARLTEAVARAANAPEFKAELVQSGAEWNYMDPAATADLWSEIDTNVKAALALAK